MAFDYTNFLEVAAAVNADFVFTNRAGVVGTPISTTVANGQWAIINGPTGSSGTGASANPPGRIASVYNEQSGNVASTVWAIRRNATFDNTGQNVFLDLKLCLFAETATVLRIEYATVASPNETTDWTILQSLNATGADAWTDHTFDFSAVPKTTTLHIRIRIECSSNFANDINFSTWREYGIDTTVYEIAGVTKDQSGAPLGGCQVFLLRDNGDNTLAFLEHSVSDPVTGAYAFQGGGYGTANHLVLAWKDDAPHVFDCSDHVLQGVAM